MSGSFRDAAAFAGCAGGRVGAENLKDLVAADGLVTIVLSPPGFDVSDAVPEVVSYWACTETVMEMQVELSDD
jgi:hypothetical protein